MSDADVIRRALAYCAEERLTDLAENGMRTLSDAEDFRDRCRELLDQMNTEEQT